MMTDNASSKRENKNKKDVTNTTSFKKKKWWQIWHKERLMHKISNRVEKVKYGLLSNGS